MGGSRGPSMSMSRSTAKAYRDLLTYRAQANDTAWARGVAGLWLQSDKPQRLEIERQLGFDRMTHLFTRSRGGYLVAAADQVV